MCVFVSAVGDEVCQQGSHIVCLLCVMCSYIVHKIGDTPHAHSNNMRERSVLVSFHLLSDFYRAENQITANHNRLAYQGALIVNFRGKSKGGGGVTVILKG